MAFFALVLSAVSASLCIWFSTERFLLLHRGARTTGTVVDLIANRGKRTGFKPVIEFHDRAGIAHTFAPGTTGYTRGEAVSVIYDGANPGAARIDSFRQYWQAPIAFGVLAFLIGIPAWLELRVSSRA